MKLLIDTTYLLPAIDISIKGLPNDVLIKGYADTCRARIGDIRII